MNVYARFDEIPSMTLKDIKKTKRYGRTDGRTDGWTDNVKTVYPPTNTVCGSITKPLETDRCKFKKGDSVSEALALFNCSLINHTFKIRIINIQKIVQIS